MFDWVVVVVTVCIVVMGHKVDFSIAFMSLTCLCCSNRRTIFAALVDFQFMILRSLAVVFYSLQVNSGPPLHADNGGRGEVPSCEDFDNID